MELSYKSDHRQQCPFNNLATAGLVNPMIQNYINKYLPHAECGHESIHIVSHGGDR